MSIEHLRPEFVDTFPATLEDGVLFISIEFCTCAHLCACGCGEEVVTPLSPAQWSFTYDGKDVSLRPSVGNWTLSCRSHYLLDQGRVRWARQFSQREISLNRARDRLLVESDDWAENHNAYTDWLGTSRDRQEGTERRGSRWGRLRHWLVRRN